MGYAAHFAVDLEPIPERERAEIRQVMNEIAQALDGVAPSNPFWSSARNSMLTIDAAGYRVVYRLEPAKQLVRVVELSPLRR